MNLANILYEDRCAVRHLNGNVVEILDARWRRIGAHCVLRITDFGGTRREREILRIYCIHDVQWREPPGHEFRRVDIHHDLAVFAARRSWQRYPGNWRQ